MIPDKKLETGVRARQTDDVDLIARNYSDWHRTLDRSLIALDVDFVEWRIINGVLMPVAVIEITRAKRGLMMDDDYLNIVLRRFEERTIQARTARYIAAALKVKAYIVLFLEDCSWFWVYNLSDKCGWYSLTPAQYEDFLKKL